MGGVASTSGLSSGISYCQKCPSIRSGDLIKRQNLFCFEMPVMPSWDAENPAIEKYLELFAQYEIELPTQYPLVSDLYSRQLEVVIRHQVPIVSFTFGVPNKEVINTIQAYGGKVWMTVTNLLEAKQAQNAGADALILQGYEAGGHRASFNPDAKPSEQIGLISLLQLIADSIDIPFIASGGLMTGKSIFASMVLGAVAGQLGTAFLSCEEAQLTSSWREALVGAGGTDTVLTRSFSGRLARGIVNKHTRVFEKVESQIPPFPYINAMTGPLRTRAKKADSCDHQSLWAGQSCSLARFMTAANLLELLSREIKQAASF